MGDAMSFSSVSPAGSAGIVHVADLRPVADAAATRRQSEIALPVPPAPASAFPPVSPPSAVSSGEVGRSLLAAVSAGNDLSADQGEGERRLKPWGVAMLPHELPKATQTKAEEKPAERSEPAFPGRQTAAETAAAERLSPPENATPRMDEATEADPRAEGPDDTDEKDA